MPNCGAPNCTNRSNEENGKNKTFHKLPAESRKNIRKEWLVKIKKDSMFQNICTYAQIILNLSVMKKICK